MSKRACLKVLTVVVVMLAVGVKLHAQTGCIDSPENPTAVLALVGAAGAVVAKLRRR
jgi:XrtJ-associated TM-motif-TM protein